MKRSFCTLALTCCLVSGCGHDQAATVGDAAKPDDETSVETTAESKPVVWDASHIDGGEMFKGYPEFRDYVRRSTFIAKGTLTRWDRETMQGSVAVEHVLLGDPNKREVALVSDGGMVLVQPGDKVLILLRVRDGSLKLNSFCGVSGMTRWSHDIATIVRSALQPL